MVIQPLIRNPYNGYINPYGLGLMSLSPIIWKCHGSPKKSLNPCIDGVVSPLTEWHLDGSVRTCQNAAKSPPNMSWSFSGKNNDMFASHWSPHMEKQHVNCVYMHNYVCMYVYINLSYMISLSLKGHIYKTYTCFW